MERIFTSNQARRRRIGPPRGRAAAGRSAAVQSAAGPIAAGPIAAGRSAAGRNATGLIAAALMIFGLAAAKPVEGLSPDLAISQLTLRTWQSGQGLPQNSVRDLAQTPDGYLWIATQAGLARFDGVRFEVWRRSAELPSDQVSSLAADQEGALWIGTLGGLAVYQSGRLEAFTPELEPDPSSTSPPSTSLSKTAPQIPASWRIRSLAADDHGGLCVGTNGQGVLRREANGRWRHYAEPDGVPSLDFRAIEVDGLGGCWAGSLGAGLIHIDGSGGVRSIELPTRFVWSLHRGRGGLWIGTDLGIYQLDGERVREAPFSADLTRPRIGAILEDQDGNLWIGTQGGGLKRWNGRRVESLHSPEGGSGPVIWSLLEDREGQLWFGSLSGGLSRLEEGLFVPFGVREGLTSHQTHAVTEAPDGGVFVATNSGGIQHIQADGSVRAYTTADGLSSDTAWSLFVDADRRLWIGTANRGIDRLDPDGTVAHLDGDDGLPSQRILGVLVDRQDRLWVGTEVGATVLRESETGDWRRLEALELTDFGAVTLLLEGRGGRMWLAAREGLVSYSEGGSYRLLSPKNSALPGAPVWALAEGEPAPDGQDRLWIGTFGDGLGLVTGDFAAGFGTDQGLPSNDVTSIVADGLGNLWLATTNGLVRVDENQLAEYMAGVGEAPPLRIFDRRDGLRSAESYGGLPIGTLTSEGQLWFATMSGVVRIDPRAVAAPRPPPRVLIESLTVDGEPIKRAAPQAVRLTPDPREIRIRYTAATLSASQRIRFRYRLMGFSDQWSEVAERREAFFTNLEPGIYQFEVQASDDLGHFPAESSGPYAKNSLELEIAPRFVETTAFAVLAGVALILLGFGVQQARVSRLRRREEELQRVADEAAANVRTLRGLMPICASCKMVRDDEGYWNQLEVYLDQHSEARLSHGLCPACLENAMAEAEIEPAGNLATVADSGSPDDSSKLPGGRPGPV